MRTLIIISLRNIFRQKRRYILLGTAVAFSTAFLHLASAFSHGISATLFERVISSFTGHVTISILRDGYQGASVFNNREKLMSILSSKLTDVTQIYESITGYARIMGNGKTDNCFLTGIEPKSVIPEGFKMVDGDLSVLNREDIENPVIIPVKQATALNVRIGDILQIRYTDNYGQYQTARLTVSGTCISTSFLTDLQVMIHTDDLKNIQGFKANDCGPVFIMLKYPRSRAARVADSLHTCLKPPIAIIKGSIEGKYLCNKTASIFGMKTDSISVRKLGSILNIDSDYDTVKSILKNAVLISYKLADTLQIKSGDTCRITWKSQFENDSITVPVVITSLFASDSFPSAPGLLINEKAFYRFYYEHWPANTSAWSETGSCIDSILSTEWILLPRNKSTTQMSQRYWELFENPPAAAAFDVMSMYESGSAVTGIESALKMLSLCMVLILFFIIYIGIMNTLRLTIKERTGEIGTMRAIGMQKRDIRRVFLMEVSLFALFSALSGTAISFVVIAFLKTVKITIEGPFSILLTDGHLPLSPSVGPIAGYILFIIISAAVISWFPSNKAANLPPASALRSIKN